MSASVVLSLLRAMVPAVLFLQQNGGINNTC